MKKKVIIAPLDWGLGHATRCIPIVNYFIAKNWEVIIASDGRAMALYEKEYPQLQKWTLPSYDVQYKYQSMALNVFKAGSSIFTAIYSEKKQLKKRAEQEKIDLIISDNRYGFSHKDIPSIMITHQTSLIIPFLPVKWIVDKSLSIWINQFTECWIPDNKSKPRLSGILSQSKRIKAPFYMGILSRMEKLSLPKNYDVCVIMSGPEPQRTYLEKILYAQAEKLTQYKFIFIAGKSDEKVQSKSENHIKKISFLGATALNEVICSSELIIARSGYSTLMDLVSTQSKALLIPTPGQSEQEYLAACFKEQAIAFVALQNNIDLSKMIPQAISFSKPILMKNEITAFLDTKVSEIL